VVNACRTVATFIKLPPDTFKKDHCAYFACC
jgi:hypothetical protein